MDSKSLSNDNNNDNPLLNETIYFNEVINFNKLNKSNDIPNIQIKSKNIELFIYSQTNPTNFIESKGYNHDNDDYYDIEMNYISKIDQLVDIGNEYLAYLYSYRSLSKALPEINIDTSNDINSELLVTKNEINRKVCEIMKSSIIKLKEIILYVSDTIQLIYNIILYLNTLEQKKSVIPLNIYLSLLKLFDILFIIDYIKDNKTSLLNDFSRYKRAITSTHQLSIDIQEEIIYIQNFFISNDNNTLKYNILYKLRNEIKKINNHEDILIDILDTIIYYIDKELYVNFNELHRYIRLLPYLIILIDGEKNNKTTTNIFKAYNKKMFHVQKICIQYPIIPVFNDLSMKVIYLIQLAANFDEKSMYYLFSPEEASENIPPVKYNVSVAIESYKLQSFNYMNSLSIVINSLKIKPFIKNLTNSSIQLSNEVVKLVKQGFKLLSDMNGLLFRYVNWKYNNPNNNNDMNIDIEYAKIFKYNLSENEVEYIIELIHLIKSVTNYLFDIDDIVAPIIRYHIHLSIQELLQLQLLPLLHRLDKRNKKVLLQSILSVRKIAIDWKHGIEPRDDYKNYTSKNVITSNSIIQSNTITNRIVGPNIIQLQLLRSHIYSIYHHRSIHHKKDAGMFSKAELRSEDSNALEKFYEDSYIYSYLLNYTNELHILNDCSYLWYREYYLELTKSIQYPIDISIPWICCEYLINSSNNITKICYVLDIYNDCTYQALYKYQLQYLYNEIEAECSLVFDQIVYLLADEIYDYYKNLSAYSFIESNYIHKLIDIKKESIESVSIHIKRYDIILLQKTIGLLGRSINLMMLLNQHINNKILKDVDICIKKFESIDLSGVIELNVGLSIIQQTHKLLITNTSLQLDSYINIFNEINLTFSPTNYRGRISFHTLKTLICDIFINFNYNLTTHRFIRSIDMIPLDYIKPPKQVIVNTIYGNSYYKAYEKIFQLTRGYVGRYHFETLVNELYYCADIYMIIEETLKNLYDKLVDINGYIGALHGGIPPIPYPSFKFMSAGAYGYYMGKLRPLLEYDDLKPKVYQMFREIGNTIGFYMDLSTLLDIKHCYEFNQLAPFLGIAPDSTINDLSSISNTPIGNVIINLTNNNLYNNADICTTNNLIDQLTTSLTNYTNQTNISLVNKKSLIYGIFNKIEEYMYQLNLFNDWGINTGSNDGLNYLDIDKSRSFYKLWSSLCFLYCLSIDVNKSTNISNDLTNDLSIENFSDEEIFGHGFTISGCLFIHLLKQRILYSYYDFTSYIIKAYHYEQSTKYTRDSITLDQSLINETNSFINNAREHLQLQGHIFELFEGYYNHNDKMSSNNFSYCHSKHRFHPTED